MPGQLLDRLPLQAMQRSAEGEVLRFPGRPLIGDLQAAARFLGECGDRCRLGRGAPPGRRLMSSARF
jgi:hypothetical protein